MIGLLSIVCSLLGCTAEADGGDQLALASRTAPPAAAELPPVRPETIAVAVQRLDGRSGGVLVSSGVPLAPGALRPGQEREVRLWLDRGGAAPVEQAMHVAALAGRHRDGSVRAILVQFVDTLSPASLRDGRLVLGEARPAAATRPRVAAPPGLPAAVVLPTSPEYLVGTGLVGSTQTSADGAARGGAFARYEADFAKWADYQWQHSAEQWAGNYYDRALIYRAMWARTGRVDYWDRANRMAVAYRRDYLEANDYGSSPYWYMGEGLEQHYLATGDSLSRYAVGRVAEQFIPLVEQLDDRSDWMESRNQARTLQALRLAWRLDARGREAHDWTALLDRSLDLVLSTQEADGSYRWPIFCGSNGTFMYGLLNDQLIDHYTYYKADPRIPVAVERAVRHVWDREWLPRERAFRYMGVLCRDVGGPAPAPDLTLMQAASFAWVAARSGDPEDAARARAVFDAGVEGAYLIGAKQFNEAYNSSWRAFAPPPPR